MFHSLDLKHKRGPPPNTQIQAATQETTMSAKPDVVRSSVSVKNEPVADHAPAPSSSIDLHDDDDDPVVRTIDVYISPALSKTLHLLQFPIQPSSVNSKHQSNNVPNEAKFRPDHCMLELEYAIPGEAMGATRQLPDTMSISQRTFTSNAIPPVTHMALAKLDRSGARLDVVPMQRNVLQMRPSFRHLHMHDDEEEVTPPVADATAEANEGTAATGGKQKPIMFQKKETERSVNSRRNSYAYKRASEESEEWIDLDVHGDNRDGKWTPHKKDLMKHIVCENRGKELKLAISRGVAAAANANSNDGGYVRSLNYLDTIALARSSHGSAFVDNLSEWTPSGGVPSTAAEHATGDADEDMEDVEQPTSTPSIGAAEQATAELAAKLALLLQNGNGTMIPYRVIRSRFNDAKVTDEMLTMALSSCAVLVRGNFALMSHLTQFLKASGGGTKRVKLMRELRDLILLLLNMHGMVQRERMIRAYNEKANDYGEEYTAIITPDIITFVLETVAKRSTDNCWVAKVEDDAGFAGRFPEVAAHHGVYWTKKKAAMEGLISYYEDAYDE